ncbi:hypothetical protein GCM10010372_80690 [Streptomyces tauricus]|nr:hypothetical protein GCM10010372_80690 [Streptomyces tauricus]
MVHGVLVARLGSGEQRQRGGEFADGGHVGECSLSRRVGVRERRGGAQPAAAWAGSAPAAVTKARSPLRTSSRKARTKDEVKQAV